jgi:putative hydrolase of the HAD superfamily
VSQRVEAILLDAGGVLTLPDPELVRAQLAADRVRPDVEALDRAHYVGVAALDRAGGGEQGYEAFLRAYVAAAGFSPRGVGRAAERLDRAIKGADNAWSRVCPGALAGLRSLCAAGLKVVIVSNSNGTVERSLVSMGVCQVGPGAGASVAGVVDSAVVGIAKPDSRIFTLALSRAGVPADRALHVGDSVHADVEGAGAAGVRPIHLDPYGLCQAQDHEHVATLTEVADLIAQETESSPPKRSRRRAAL